MDLLIPASGYATRMNRIPKFLLPVNLHGTSLLETHISAAEPFYENIYIGTRKELMPLLNEKLLSPKLRLVSLETSTMTETIVRLCEESSADTLSVVMPDTYFYGESPHEFLTSMKADLQLCLWNIREDQKGKLGQVAVSDGRAIEVIDKNPKCDFPYSWGALSFSRIFLEFLEDSMPHVGYGIQPSISAGLANVSHIMDGKYFDCGTPAEYFELVSLLRSS